MTLRFKGCGQRTTGAPGPARRLSAVPSAQCRACVVVPAAGRREGRCIAGGQGEAECQAVETLGSACQSAAERQFRRRRVTHVLDGRGGALLSETLSRPSGTVCQQPGTEPRPSSLANHPAPSSFRRPCAHRAAGNSLRRVRDITGGDPQLDGRRSREPGGTAQAGAEPGTAEGGKVTSICGRPRGTGGAAASCRRFLVPRRSRVGRQVRGSSNATGLRRCRWQAHASPSGHGPAGAVSGPVETADFPSYPSAAPPLRLSTAAAMLPLPLRPLGMFAGAAAGSAVHRPRQSRRQDFSLLRGRRCLRAGRKEPAGEKGRRGGCACRGAGRNVRRGERPRRLCGKCWNSPGRPPGNFASMRTPSGGLRAALAKRFATNNTNRHNTDHTKPQDRRLNRHMQFAVPDACPCKQVSPTGQARRCGRATS